MPMYIVIPVDFNLSSLACRISQSLFMDSFDVVMDGFTLLCYDAMNRIEYLYFFQFKRKPLHNVSTFKYKVIYTMQN